MEHKIIHLKYQKFFYLIIMLFISIGFGFYSVYLGIDADADSYNYHFYNGFAFVNDRTFVDFAPAGLHSYFNPILDALVYLGITKIPQQYYAFSLGFLQGLNIIPIYYIAEKLFNTFSINKFFILLVSLIGLFQSLFLTQLGISMHDSLTSLFVLTCLALFLNNLNNNIKGFYIPAFIIGVIVGLKLTNATYGISLALIMCIYSIMYKRYILIINIGFLMVGGFLLSNGWWMYKLWIHFDNPFYPYMNNIFKSSWAVTDAEAYIDKYFFRQHGLQKLFYPIFFSNEPGLASGYYGWPLHSFYKEAVAYLLALIVILAMFSRKWRSRRKYLKEYIILFFIFCAVSYFIWYLKFGVMRYLMPVLLLCPIIISLSLFLILLERVNSKKSTILSKSAVYPSYGLSRCTGRNLFFFILVITCSFLSYEDLKNGFPKDLHKPFSEKFIQDNKLSEYDANASIYFITGSPIVWQAWIFPALDLKGTAMPLRSGIFKYENEKLLNQRASYIDNILGNKNNYAIVIRDLTGEGWISKPTSDNETIDELKRYGLKLSDDCREYDSGFGSNIRRLKFCNVEPL